MFSCFYNTKGWMMSAGDFHKYVGPPPSPVPIPHLTMSLFGDMPIPKELVFEVTMEGRPSAQQGFTHEYVTHIPMANPFPPPELLLLSYIVWSSTTQAMYAVLSVSAKGTPLACCEVLWNGTNINCSEPFGLPVGGVTNHNSVVTLLTGGDKAAAWRDYLAGLGADALFAWVFKHTLDKLFSGVKEKLAKKIEDVVLPKLEKELLDVAKEATQSPGLKELSTTIVDKLLSLGNQLPVVGPYLPLTEDGAKSLGRKVTVWVEEKLGATSPNL
jgi:hypothetical protein